jgi:hypothetical protein
MMLRCELDSSGSEQIPVKGCYVHGNEPSGVYNVETLLIV